MKSYIKKVLLFVGVPVSLLVLLYIFTDPFKTLRPFTLDDFYVENRDYVSTELFIRNYPKYKYDSFIMGSCRSARINTYHWKKYLPEGSRPYMFQAWGETLTGMENKLAYLDDNDVSINNVMLIFDIPNTFSEKQMSNDAILIQDYKTSHKPYLLFQATLFYDFVQKPSIWGMGIKRMLGHKDKIVFDTITNDWSLEFQKMDVNVCPPQDSLKKCPPNIKDDFFRLIQTKTDKDLTVYDKQINSKLQKSLIHIKEIFDKHNTKYKIVISPAYCYKYPAINDEDLNTLRQIFGNVNVFDFSHKNTLNSDYNNFYDPDHFGLCVGWKMIEEMYNSKP